MSICRGASHNLAMHMHKKSHKFYSLTQLSSAESSLIFGETRVLKIKRGKIDMWCLTSDINSHARQTLALFYFSKYVNTMKIPEHKKNYFMEVICAVQAIFWATSRKTRKLTVWATCKYMIYLEI